MSAPDRIVGTSIGGRYRVQRKLGEGGMGAVYEAEGPDGTRVAVKIIHQEIAGTNSQALARFVQETRASVALRSPHIVAVLDSGVDEDLGVPFLVMELLAGGDVEDLVTRSGPLEPATAVRIAVEAARGLGVAHQAGIVHRDIKPANLFLARSDSGVVTVKLCDFGIAKVSGPDDYRLTQTGSVIGSVFYMSPEQTRSSKHVDVRSDVWSLAVTLYEMLTGRTPTHPESRSAAEILVAINTTDAANVQDFAPWVDPDLAVALHRGLVRNVEERCPSIQLFERSLSQFGELRSLEASGLRGVSAETRGKPARRATLSTWREVSPRQSPDGEIDLVVGKLLAGRYRLDQLLGRGGMGAVYEADDQHANARVAVKVILAESTPKGSETRRRFVREARAAASITSPHVVRVLDADTDPVSDAPFIVMELLSGLDLDQLVRDKGAVEPLTVTRLFLQACEGLSAAHAQSLIHRDIKPANLFLHIVGADVTLKLCDFGIAKNTASEAIEGSTGGLTRTGGLLGSPVYMSPEQAKNAKNVDARSDIWSLSLAMYEALTGVRPWAQCTTIGELILAICTEDMPPLSTLVPWVNADLAKVVERGLKRNVDERWPTVDELTQALRPFAGADLLVTRAMLTSVSEEVRKSARRAPDAFAATVAPSNAPPAPDAALSADAALASGTSSGLATNVAAQSGFDQDPRPEPGRSRRAVVLGAAGLAMVGAAASFALLGQSETTRGDATEEPVGASVPGLPPTPSVTPEPTVLRDGAVAPSSIEVAAPTPAGSASSAPSASSASSAPSASSASATPRPGVTGGARPALPKHTAAVPPTTTAPTATTVPTAVKPDFQQEWNE